MNKMKSFAAASVLMASGIAVGAGTASATSVSACASGKNICATATSGYAWSVNSGPALNGAANTAHNWAQVRADYTASVKKIQARLGVAQDGVYGPATARAVAFVEYSHHLAQDGVVGPRMAGYLGLNYYKAY